MCVLSEIILFIRMVCAGVRLLSHMARARPCTADGSAGAGKVLARIMAELGAEYGAQKVVMIDAAYLKAHCTATRVVAKKVA